MCHACALMQYWSDLYAEMDQDQLVEGADLMLKVAKEVLAAQPTRQTTQLLLQNDDLEQEDDST